ncbi:MAG: hypothetical protein Unbinned3205contig1001_14 [Prokaryotic dsDNA virus sp.]|nr:MAG: hypothetical protein Unbinned3205contig1001_14 [Prokaryotic dsDNA virus sp.]|tara:strand:+ start:19113 stop:19319 length:207 start_codon:yes stop_codon:yes gene_type:complete
MAELQNKEWMFNFIGGGWNTVYAKTRRGAITKAIKEYADSKTLNVDTDTMKRVDKNPEVYRGALSLFY